TELPLLLHSFENHNSVRMHIIEVVVGGSDEEALVNHNISAKPVKHKLGRWRQGVIQRDISPRRTGSCVQEHFAQQLRGIQKRRRTNRQFITVNSKAETKAKISRTIST